MVDARPLAELRREAAVVSDDPALALALAHAQQAAGDTTGALLTLHRAGQRPDSPAYFAYLEAQLATEAGEWKTAWEAWRQYLVATSNR